MLCDPAPVLARGWSGKVGTRESSFLRSPPVHCPPSPFVLMGPFFLSHLVQGQLASAQFPRTDRAEALRHVPPC
ncbi:hypothetical protein KTAU_02780 [Thermogemmatispora aurantia]|uniref:Uncharacterized protein n=1 Tax=Thermogemmatispora aurantia TaxID=2045279 RepID=A0A5J4K4D8_9CHLR|nr:hypothetical protein KTAU_02780 [Thermogemmatispora aurantia]